MLDQLSLTKGKKSWGIAFRRSAIHVSEADFRVIGEAMGAF